MPIVVRIVAAVFLITVGICLAFYVVKSDRRWLSFASLLCRLGLVIALIFLGLYALERVAMFL